MILTNKQAIEIGKPVDTLQLHFVLPIGISYNLILTKMQVLKLQ